MRCNSLYPRLPKGGVGRPHPSRMNEVARTKGKLYPTLLTCPTDHPDLASHEQVDWSRLGQDDPDKKDLIRTYKGLYEKRKPPMQTIVSGISDLPSPNRPMLHP